MLFGKSVPNHDRYHGFQLYKAITQYCKDTAVPRKELMGLVPIFGVLDSGAHPLEFDVVI